MIHDNKTEYFYYLFYDITNFPDMQSLKCCGKQDILNELIKLFREVHKCE